MIRRPVRDVYRWFAVSVTSQDDGGITMCSSLKKEPMNPVRKVFDGAVDSWTGSEVSLVGLLDGARDVLTHGLVP